LPHDPCHHANLGSYLGPWTRRFLSMRSKSRRWLEWLRFKSLHLPSLRGVSVWDQRPAARKWKWKAASRRAEGPFNIATRGTAVSRPAIMPSCHEEGLKISKAHSHVVHPEQALTCQNCSIYIYLSSRGVDLFVCSSALVELHVPKGGWMLL
jgi:hypothetical protein